MANTLKKIFVPGLDQVAQTYTIESWHISQSIDALTGAEAYDLTLSGSLTLTGSLAINGLTDPALTDVLTIDTTTGQIYYTSSTAIAPINNYINSTVTNNYTSSTVNNNFSTSSVVNNYTASTVNNPGGSDTHIQYNSGSTFGGDIYLRYDYVGRNFIHGTGLSLGADNFIHGDQVTASNNFSHAEGTGTQANGYGSHAEGSGTISQGSWSHTEGVNTIASGDASHAEGLYTTSTGDTSHAEGDSTISFGQSSHAEGYQTLASGAYSHAEGYQTIALGQASHAEGYQTTASGNYSYAGGYRNKSVGLYSFSTGISNLASGAYSFAAGALNNANGANSVAFGYNTYSGNSSLSAGILTSASGQYSVAYGQQTIAAGQASFTAGNSTTANGNYQTAVGYLNELDSSPYAFIVGGGTGATRKTLIFASGSQFQLSGSFAPQYRNITNVNTSSLTSPGVAVNNRDYNITFAASNIFSGKNAISLPSNVPVGTVIYLQRTSGTNPLNAASTVQISGSAGYLINGAAGYSFPTTIYARRMFVFSGAATGWYTEPNPIV
jgi:hypothetical protein